MNGDAMSLHGAAGNSVRRGKGPVDVLAVLNEAQGWLYRSSESRGDDDRAEAVEQARQAVAELIEAVVDAAMRRTHLASDDYRSRMDRLYAAIYAANGDKPLAGDLASRVPANLADALARFGGAK